MNKNLDRCLPYPFERLADLLSGVTPNPDRTPIRWSIGEPAHASPEFVKQALRDSLDGLSKYPVTKGSDELRIAIAEWLTRRYALPANLVDAERNVLPVTGTREAIFSFAQSVIDPSPDALVAMPNPFYQIYEGAAFLAGASPLFLNLSSENGFLPDFSSVTPDQWRRCQLLYVCSPSNPAGSCLKDENWLEVLDLADRYGFVVAADECYSEIYDDESNPPVGLLQAAARAGRHDFRGLVVFHSLSKRSNLPGLRSGFIAGDAEILEKYRLYRTYHGCAMSPPVQDASTAAWRDEEHVVENRRLYRAKFDAVLAALEGLIDVYRPQAAFYLWPRVEISDTEFARLLYKEENLLVLPGSYISRPWHGTDPGAHRLRMALVAPFDQCVEGAQRLARFAAQLRVS